MAKGLFTQGFVVLLRHEIEIDEIKPTLADFEIVKEVEPAENWEFGGPSLLVAFDRSVNGYISIDVVNRPWPDHMGDVKNETTLFGAWGTGQFGPFTYPKGLERAVQQSRRWDEAKSEVSRHSGFIRMRISYVFGGPKDAPITPANYAPMKELEFLTALTSCVLRHPSALCYFNPNGEVVMSREAFNKSVELHAQHNIPPLEIWTNIRLFSFDNDWLILDSVGCWQFDLPDHEVAFPKTAFSCQEVDAFIRNTTFYLIKHGMIIKDMDTMDGPGKKRWQAVSFKHGLAAPPRKILRWLPPDINDNDIPEQLLNEKYPE